MLVISVYLNDDDATVFLNWLNSQHHTAFLIPTAENCWQAISPLESTPKVPIDVWQISAGPLPHYLVGSSVSRSTIEDPFAGWCGRAESFIPSLPFFGSCPHTLRLTLEPSSKYSWEKQRRIGPNTTNTLGLSAIAWRGDRHKVIGYPAHPDMKRLWSKIREFVRTRSKMVSAADFLPRKDYYAFPGAYRDILRGRLRAPSR